MNAIGISDFKNFKIPSEIPTLKVLVFPTSSKELSLFISIKECIVVERKNLLDEKRPQCLNQEKVHQFNR